MPEFVEVHVTTPDEETAERLAALLVQERLAACAQVAGPIRSTYRWQGTVETAAEFLLVAKAPAEAFAAICDRVGAEHPYETPEIIAVPITHASVAYAAWLAESTATS